MARKTKRIRTNTAVLIVVEGQTEDAYFSQMKTFERFRNLSINIRTAPHSNPQSVLGYAIDEVRENHGVYDVVWCVFDWDVVVRDNLYAKIKPLIKALNSQGGIVISSFPSIEVWFLTHYRVPNVFYHDQSDVITDLIKYLPDYCKEGDWMTRRGLYAKLKPLQNIAFDNVSTLKLRTNGKGNPTFTDVSLIFERLFPFKS